MTGMTGLRSRAGKYLRDAGRGIQRAPVEVIATLCAAITFSWAIELGDDAFRSWLEVAVPCALLLAVAWTGTFLNAMGTWSSARRWAVTVAGMLLIMGYAVWVADFEYEAETWRAALLLAAAVMWLVALPAFAGGEGSRVDRMRRVDGRILLRGIGAGLYGAALFGGLALALRAIDVLFELNIEEQIYLHVWGWIAFVLVPWIVLGGLADYIRPIEHANAVAGVAQRIVSYLVPPLLVLYFLILYAYVVRILVTGEIPKNLVSPMVLAAGALGALALMLFDPRPAAASAFRWLRAAPVIFLPLAPLGAWALIVRIDQYGWTEFRLIRLALLVALGVLAVGAAIQLARRRAFILHAIPLSLALLFLLSAVGPWSAITMARRSQQARLAEGLARVGVAASARSPAMPAESSDSTARVVPAADYEQVRGSAQYLASHFGPEALPPALQFERVEEEARWLDYAAALGLRPDVPVDGTGPGLGGSLPQHAGVRIDAGTAYRVYLTQRAPGGREGSAEPGQGPHVLLLDSTHLSVRLGNEVLYADLTTLVASLSRSRHPGGGRGLLPADRVVVPVTDPAGSARGELVVWHLWLESDSTGTRPGNLEGLLVVRD